ncbi:hypothetical protein [Bacillus stratosphericus]|uniref:hypothetical protein n=1 Tax=Bacillus stratosphericus TaxID=293386 RepID=UPI001CFA4BF5|nr:hypothetical protein [Bacillus stratosphericus]
MGVQTDGGWIIWHREYEVIVGEHTPASNLDEMDYDELVTLVEDTMKALRTRSYKNGYEQGRFDAEIEAAHGTYEMSDQQKRDDIVAQAKNDIEALYKRDLGYRHDFIVNAEKRTVVALRKSFAEGYIRDRGIAKCAPNDCFNAHIGKAIALRRALRLPVPPEYLNVPQPTEVRVGDVIRGTYYNKKSTYTKTVKKIEDGAYFYESDYDFINGVDLVIIDDSRAGEGE